MPLPVKLQDVVDALEAAGESSLHFLDKRTGEIVMLTDEEWEAAEADELISTYPEWQREVVLKAREIQKSEDFVELPDKAEIDEYEMMETFAREYEDQRTSAELLRSIKGKGAFQRFRLRSPISVFSKNGMTFVQTSMKPWRWSGWTTRGFLTRARE